MQQGDTLEQARKEFMGYLNTLIPSENIAFGEQIILPKLLTHVVECGISEAIGRPETTEMAQIEKLASFILSNAPDEPIQEDDPRRAFFPQPGEGAVATAIRLLGDYASKLLDPLKLVREMVARLGEEFGIALRMTPALIDAETFESRHLFYFVHEGNSLKLHSQLNPEKLQEVTQELPTEDVDLLETLTESLRTELRAWELRGWEATP